MFCGVFLFAVFYPFLVTASQEDKEKAEDLLLSISNLELNDNQRRERLEQAYDLLAHLDDKVLTGNILYELAVLYLHRGDKQSYQSIRQKFEAFAKRDKGKESNRFLRLLSIEQMRRDSDYKGAIDIGEELIAELNPHIIPKVSRIKQGVFAFTLSDLAKVNKEVGICHFYLGAYETAYRYFNKALNYQTALGDKLMIASMYGNLSAVSWSQNDFEKALEFIERAIELTKEVGDTRSLLLHRTNKAIYLIELKKPAEGKQLFLSIVNHPRVKSYPQIHVTSLVNLSHLLTEEGNTDEAEKALNLAMSLAIEINNEKKMNDVNRQLANVKIVQKAYDQALPLLEASAKYFEDKGMKRDLAKTYKLISDTYKKLTNYKQVAHYLELHYGLMIELQNQSRQKKIAELQESFEAQQREIEIKKLKHNNEVKSLEIRSRNYFIIMLIAIGSLVVFFIILQLKSKQRTSDQLKVLSLSDPLTNIGNRRFFVANIDNTLANVKRESANEQKIGIFVLDIDHFKQVNDDMGHDYGDMVLVEFSQRLKATLRESDLFVRWGGEEFVVAARLKDDEDVHVVAAKMLEAVNAREFGTSIIGPRQITCSIGGVVYPFIENQPEQPSWNWLVSAADKALYQAKNSGRNCWYVLANRAIKDVSEVGTTKNIDKLLEQEKLVFETKQD